MKNICVITGTRADYGFLEPVIEAIGKNTNLKLLLLVTGMHTLNKFGQTIKEIKKNKQEIAAIIPIGEEDDMLTALTKEIIGIRNFCVKNKVDVMVLLGDRHEQLAGAIVAGYLKIPIAHIHGGDISSGVIDDSVRHAITKFAHLHFPVSKFSQERVLALGEEKWRVFVTGSPGLDSLRNIKYLNKKQIAKQLGISEKTNWILFLQHPAFLDSTPIRNQIVPTLQALQTVAGEKIIIYPNSDTGSEIFIDEIKRFHNHKDFHIYKNLPRQIYASLMKVSSVLMGNSSSGIIEAGYFKLPVINVGGRQEGREHGRNVIDTDYDYKEIKIAIKKCLSDNFKKACLRREHPYGSGRTGKFIVKTIVKMLKKKNLLKKKFTYV